MPFGYDIITGPPNPVPKKNETPKEALEREQLTLEIDEKRGIIASVYYNLLYPFINTPKMGPNDTFF